ncbi:MAG: neutral/alkaline non-lysosomal ceramidase N-terminal domain-containing protein [Kiritimatiellae bacterium]|nr:neutral/alkaline non-lysosomal ceramidase N-terminal domain-containing protein [Kiritimatiellia bacterium]
MKQPVLRAGIFKVDITPPPDFAEYCAADGHSAGIHDKLHARILFLNDGQKAALLIACDLIAIQAEHVQAIRKAIARQLPVDANAIMVAATHTHSSPDTISLFNQTDAAYIEYLSAKIIAGACQAFAAAVDCRVSAGKGRLEGVSRNRRIKMKDGTVQAEWWHPDPSRIAGPAGPIDPEVGILKIEDSGGNPLALLVNYACHLTVTSRNRQYSADFAGHAMNILEKELGTTAFFLNGACGNINPNKSDSTFEGSEQLGGLLAEAVRGGLKDAQPLHSCALRVIREPITLNWRDFPTVAEAEKRVETCKTNLNELKARGGDTISFAEPELKRSQKLLDLLKGGLRNIVTEIQAIGVGEAVFVTIPGELFAELGLAIKKGGRHVFVVGYANDYQGYIPTREAYAEGGYEVIPWPLSKLLPGTGEEIRDIALRLVKEITRA